MRFFQASSWRGWVTEVFVVAVGVGLAIAADNWNERRHERELERQFLAGVALDMELSVSNVEASISEAELLRAALERMRTALITGQHTWETPEDFVRDLVFCTYLRTPRVTSITFDELRSSGSLRLLTDRELKRDLAEFYTDFERISQFHPEYRRKEAAIEEALLGVLPLSERLEINEKGRTERTNLEIEGTLEQLRARPALIPRIEDMIWVQHRITTRYDSFVTRGREILAIAQVAVR